MTCFGALINVLCAMNLPFTTGSRLVQTATLLSAENVHQWQHTVTWDRHEFQFDAAGTFTQVIDVQKARQPAAETGWPWSPAVWQPCPACGKDPNDPSFAAYVKYRMDAHSQLYCSKACAGDAS
jgi:hypothetical protein